MTHKVRAHDGIQHDVSVTCVFVRPGLIAWQDHALRLFTAFLSCFDLPIGTATGEMKYSKVAVPRRAELWFPLHVLPMERSAAKCLVFLLRNDATDAAVLPHAAKMIDLLEQFCHPSNGGDWTTMLASFLKHLVKQLMKVTSSQVLPLRGGTEV